MSKICLWKLKRYLANKLGIKWLGRNPNILIADSALVMPTAVIDCGKSGRIEVDEKTFVNEQCMIFSYMSTIKIGKEVLIGPGTVIHTHKHNFQRTDASIKKQLGTGEQIVIEDDVWIGTNTTVMNDVGAGSILGAGSIITHDVEPYSIVAGNPARVMKRRRVNEID